MDRYSLRRAHDISVSMKQFYHSIFDQVYVEEENEMKKFAIKRKMNVAWTNYLFTCNLFLMHKISRVQIDHNS